MTEDPRPNTNTPTEHPDPRPDTGFFPIPDLISDDDRVDDAPTVVPPPVKKRKRRAPPPPPPDVQALRAFARVMENSPRHVQRAAIGWLADAYLGIRL